MDVSESELEPPSGLSRRLWRSWIVGVTGIALWPAVEIVVGPRVPVEVGSVIVAWMLLIAAPVLGVIAWHLAGTPRPSAAVLTTTGVDPGHARRKEIDRSLSRGDAEAAAGWPSYARARVAQRRRELITLGPITVLVWSQLLSRPAGEIWWWAILLAATAVTVTGVVSAVRQLRRERALGAAGAAPLT
ncbi:hypothetical protein [Pseudonocardia alni]|uniref:hypothetical protein n=1 Tax=Pseudonocardia TaxID=1847 RepID=UPI0009363A4A|nr:MULTISPECIES: hypothetical protein [Pseudonocardia]MYW75878.1 hypothetical protein [Pseudonocardia sp. SID8383]